MLPRILIAGFLILLLVNTPQPAAAADPFSSDPIVTGTWQTIRAGHQLVYLEGDRVLDWEPETGHYRIWAYDRDKKGQDDPLPGDPLVEGTWNTIRAGHHLLHLGHDRVLDWEPESGHYRVWTYDRDKKGQDDPLPGDPVAEGKWHSIRPGHHLLSLERDRVLDWEPETGHYRIRVFDRDKKGQDDPLRRDPLVEGTWDSIRTGHRLIYLGRDRVLDWEPESGHYRIWAYDRDKKG
jgi:DNA-dependent RNA polymerase auxiliary subunit epsilon